MRYDTVVVGAGVAGLVAALRLVEERRRVLLIAKGVGSTNLSPTTIDVLGYSPEPVANPSDALPGFIDANPQHPYARIGAQAIKESTEWFKGILGDYRYTGDLTHNLWLPTALGVLKPSALVPPTMAAGDLSAGGRIAVVGLRQLKDFHPRLAAANLAAAPRVSVAARSIELDPPTGGEADVGTLEFARRFDDPGFRATVSSVLADHLEPGEIVGWPAVLGLARPLEVLEDLGNRLGRPSFEIPSLPPSVPGMRLFRIIRTAIQRHGGRVIVGSEVVGEDSVQGRLKAVRAVVAARTVDYEADTFVLATGGYASGGIVMDSRFEVSEKALGLAVTGVDGPGEGNRVRFNAGYFEAQPLETSGVAVDDELRPVDASGAVTFDNLYAAGAVIAGARPNAEKSGDGISLASGYKAAAQILEGSR